jgi:hypothetical protein
MHPSPSNSAFRRLPAIPLGCAIFHLPAGLAPAWRFVDRNTAISPNDESNYFLRHLVEERP